MKISGKTLVVCAHGFRRSLLKHIDFESVLYIGANSNAHRGGRFKTIIWAGFDKARPASEKLVSSVIPCLATEASSAVLFTTDGETFTGEVEHIS